MRQRNDGVFRAIHDGPDVSYADETVASLLAGHPRAARILLNYRMHCAGCAIAPFETLAEVCLVYRVPLDRLLEELSQEHGSESEENR